MKLPINHIRQHRKIKTVFRGESAIIKRTTLKIGDKTILPIDKIRLIFNVRSIETAFSVNAP